MKNIQILINRINSDEEIREEHVKAARKELDRLNEIVREEEFKLLNKPNKDQLSIFEEIVYEKI